jgi:hypothetical protein
LLIGVSHCTRQLLDERVGHSNAAYLSEVSAQVQVEEPTLYVAGVPGEKPTFWLQSLPHLFQQHGQESRLEFLGHVPQARFVGTL